MGSGPAFPVTTAPLGRLRTTDLREVAVNALLYIVTTGCLAGYWRRIFHLALPLSESSMSEPVLKPVVEPFCLRRISRRKLGSAGYHKRNQPLVGLSQGGRIRSANVDVVDHYLKLLIVNSEILEELRSDDDCLKAFTISHNRVLDLLAVCKSLEGRPEAQLMQNAVAEYQFALFAASAGNYRHGHASLRLFLELSLSAVYFSAFEIKFRNWQRDRQDIVWGAMIDKENGVFSINFIRAFCEELADGDRTYLTMAEKTYRECSQYVHGNASTFTDAASFKFNRNIFLDWNSKAETIWICFLFSFVTRYSAFLEAETRALLEQILLENLGHIPYVRAMYGA